MESLSSEDKILTLWDQVEIKGVLLQELLTKVVPSSDHGHVKGSEPLERKASETLLE